MIWDKRNIPKEGAVAEWPKALQLREKMKSKISRVHSPAWAILNTSIWYLELKLGLLPELSDPLEA